jgi:hypothetical protein
MWIAAAEESENSVFKMSPGVVALLAASLAGLACGELSGLHTSKGMGDAGDEGNDGIATTPASDDGAGCRPLTFGSQPVALASQQASPWAITTDGANIFWLNLGQDNSVGKAVGNPPWGDGQVVAYAINGCDHGPNLLASGLAHFYSAASISGLAADSMNVYWSDAGDASSIATGLSARLLKCSIGGCGNAPPALGAVDAWSIAVNSTNIYWTNSVPDSSAGAVFTCPLAGCGLTPTTLGAADAGTGSGIALDASYVYWSTTFEVLKCSLSGCGGSPTVLLSSSSGLTNLGPLVLDADNIYFIGTNVRDALSRILVCAKMGCANQPETLATAADPSSPFLALATDGTNVYWTAQSKAAGAGQVCKCSVSGCADAPEVIASGLNYPAGIALDARNLYWTERGRSSDDGKVWAAARN